MAYTRWAGAEMHNSKLFESTSRSHGVTDGPTTGWMDKASYIESLIRDEKGDKRWVARTLTVDTPSKFECLFE